MTTVPDDESLSHLMENSRLEIPQDKENRRTEHHGTMQRFHSSCYWDRVEQVGCDPRIQTHSIKEDKRVTSLLILSLTPSQAGFGKNKIIPGVNKIQVEDTEWVTILGKTNVG